jgi:hypothetical protein
MQETPPRFINYVQEKKIHRPKKRSSEVIKIIEPRIIKLGQVPAFKLHPPNLMSSLDVIKTINFLRANGIIVFAEDEGTGFSGFFRTKEQLELLRNLGNLSIGVPDENNPSLIYYNNQRSRLGIIGCIPIVAAHRGPLKSEPTGYKLVKEKADIQGNKNTHLATIPLKKISLDSLKHPLNYPLLPQEVFLPENLKDISHVKYEKCYAIKIDANDFGKGLANARPAHQLKLIRSHIDFFNDLEDQFKLITENDHKLHIGERTTDSVTIYISDFNAKRAIEKILENKLKNSNIDIKAVGFELNNVKLTLVDNRVIYSDKPVGDPEWTKKENIYKLARDYHATELLRWQLQSHIFFEHDEDSEKMGIRK